MPEPLLLMEDVSIAFGDHVLFQHVSLRLNPGEIAVIVGDSGIGKTSLLRAIVGLGAFQGRILVSGRDVIAHSNGGTDQAAVLVTQQPNLWDHLRVLDNVALVRRLRYGESRAVSRAHAKRWLAALEVDQLSRRYPFRLSGGEQQRVSLARGIAAEPPLLLLDEVTANIDSDRKDLVARVVRESALDSRGVLIVTHDIAFARRFRVPIFDLAPTGLTQTNLTESSSHA